MDKTQVSMESEKNSQEQKFGEEYTKKLLYAKLNSYYNMSIKLI